MGGLAGITEKLFLGGRDSGKDLTKLDNRFSDAYRVGVGNTDEGLGDLRRISGDFRDLIRKGGLTDSVNREYDVQQGRISDDTVRAGRSFRAMLMQQAQQNGGYLSPAAQAALAKENEVNVNEGAFNARNQLSMDKARVSQAATEKLQGQILEIADMIRTTGLTREQMGQAGQLAIASLRHSRNKEIASSVTSWGNMMMGGM